MGSNASSVAGIPATGSGSASAAPVGAQAADHGQGDAWDELERLAEAENNDKNPEEPGGQVEGGNGSTESIDDLREAQRRKWEASKSR
jgi:hypothetical protein